MLLEQRNQLIVILEGTPNSEVYHKHNTGTSDQYRGKDEGKMKELTSLEKPSNVALVPSFKATLIW